MPSDRPLPPDYLPARPDPKASPELMKAFAALGKLPPSPYVVPAADDEPRSPSPAESYTLKGRIVSVTEREPKPPNDEPPDPRDERIRELEAENATLRDGHAAMKAAYQEQRRALTRLWNHTVRYRSGGPQVSDALDQASAALSRGPQFIAEAFQALAEAAGGRWDGVDADEYVRLIRHENVDPEDALRLAREFEARRLREAAGPS